MGLILTMYRKTIPAIQWVQDGKWVQGTTPYYLWMGHELQGKKVGFVGFGAISHAVARFWTALSAIFPSMTRSCPAIRALPQKEP